MRYYEISSYAACPTQRMINESLLSSVEDFFKDQTYKATPHAVEHLFGVLKLVIKVGKNPKLLVSVIHELKLHITRVLHKLEQLPMIKRLARWWDKFNNAIHKTMGGGYSLVDFIKMFFVMVAVNTVDHYIITWSVGAVKDWLVEVGSKITEFTASLMETWEVRSILGLISGLQFADDMVMATLAQVYKTITAPDYQQYDPSAEKAELGVADGDNMVPDLTADAVGDDELVAGGEEDEAEEHEPEEEPVHA